MLIRPGRHHLRTSIYYTGKLVTGLGLVQLLPLVVAVFLAEWNDVTALGTGAVIALGLGTLSEWRLRTSEDLRWSEGMVTVALSWLAGAAILAIPLYLSGHYGSFVDAFFDAMSGLTTSGLAVIQDLDHVTVPMNLLRHLTHFVGGQGIVIIVLTMLASSAGKVSTLYVGEARDERIVPSVVRTARFIWLVAGTYLAAGTAALSITGMMAGLTPARSLFHGVNLFMAAFDTGGFSPYSSSMGYYHSAAMEAVVIVLMLAGTLSFAVHHQLWRGRRRDAIGDLELRTLAATGLLTMAVCLIGLGRAGAFTDATALFRKGVFTIISAHTGTGFAVNAGRLYATDWGAVAPAAVVLAMALGGMASSTAGGIKAIRVALASKAVSRDVRRAIQPDAAYLLATYREKRTRRVITDEQVSGAATIMVLFMMMYLAGALVGVYYNHPFPDALFESTSAGANVGLSVGIVSPGLPLPLKLVYTVQMWLGRLEFMAVFALVGYGVAIVRGKG